MAMWPDTITQEEQDRYHNLMIIPPARRTEEENQFVASVKERIQAPKRAADAERHARIYAQDKPIPAYDPNANYPDPLDSLDYVGLNVKGRLVEQESEMKPLTEDDKSMLDFVASTGVSVQALAEIERDLRTAKDENDSPITNAAPFGKSEHKVSLKPDWNAHWVEVKERAAKRKLEESQKPAVTPKVRVVKTIPTVIVRTDWDTATSLQVTLICDDLRQSISHDAEYVMSVTYNSNPREGTRKQFLAHVQNKLIDAQRDPYKFFSIFDDLRGS